jgi:hypothetical protein
VEAPAEPDTGDATESDTVGGEADAAPAASEGSGFKPGPRPARNVGSPAVSALLDAHRRGADTGAATGLLRAVLALIAAGERNVRSGIDLGEAMADIGTAVARLSQEG